MTQLSLAASEPTRLEADTPSVDQLVAAEQVRALYRQSTPVHLANTVNAMIVAATLWRVHPRLHLSLWVLAMLTLTAARIALRRRYWSGEPRPDREPGWGRIFVLGSALAGALWGGAGALFLLHDSLIHQLLIVFVIGGMGAGAAGTLSCHLPAFYAFIVPALLPIAGRFVAWGQVEHLAMATMLGLFGGALSLVAHNVHRSMSEAFRLRFENSALLEGVETAQAALARGNQELATANTELERRVSDRTRELMMRARRERSLHRLTHLALQGVDVDTLLHESVPLLGEGLGASWVGFFEVNESGDHLEVAASCGEHDPSPRISLTDRSSLETQAFGSLAPARSSSVDSGPVVPAPNLPFNASSCGISTSISGAGGTLGVLSAYRAEGRAFDDEESAFFQTFARVLSTAVQRLEADAALQASELKLSELVRQSPDGIASWDTEGRVTSFNPALATITGRSEQEVLGHRFGDIGILTPESRKQAEMQMARVLRGQQVQPVTYALLDRSGRTHWVESNPRLITHADGSRSVYAFVRDVTERQRQDAQRAELEAQLRQAQRLEALGLLAGGIAHDFNNLLTVIIGSSSSLSRQGELPPEAKGAVDEIEHAAQAAARLTRQLLTFSRQQVMDTRVLDVHDVVDAVAALLRRIVDERIEIAIGPRTAPATVRADAAQLEQALINLVINARDAMPAGGRLEITTEVVGWSATAAPGATGDRATAGTEDATPVSSRGRLPAGPAVRISVSDSGAGMDDSTQARIFEPFFSTKGPGSGTGLGLATVHGIVQQSDGHIRVSSTPGRGTRFDILLPYVASAQRPEAISPSRPAPATAHARVLVVEDQPQVRNAIQRILRALGHTVLVASNGEEALALLAQTEDDIDLVVTDVVMPRLGGADLCHRLRQQDHQLPVLFVSGYAGDALDATITEQAHTYFLQKPFTPETLEARVSMALAERARAPLSAPPRAVAD